MWQGQNNMNKEFAGFNGTAHSIQNYCITFTHTFNHKHSRFKNSFVIKGAEITKENALNIAEILFPDYTDIQIESIENDELTLTPAEYEFLHYHLRGQRQTDLRAVELRIKDGTLRGPYIETEHDKYILNLIFKMKSRMKQFPVYHT